MPLRPYQRRALRELANSDRWTLLVSPTGSGKTHLSAEGLIYPAVLKGKRVLFVVHLREVVQDTSVRLTELGIPHGIIMAGMPDEMHHPVQVASLQTLDSRKNYPPADLVIIDECHRAASAQYRRLCAAYPRARGVGLTATPIRTDGKGLSPPDGPFKGMVTATTPSELIQQGHLVDVAAFGAATPDLERVKVDKATNDYNASALGKAYTRDARLIGEAVSNWKAFAQGERTITFCASRSHGRAVCDAFNASGVPAAYVDGTTGIPARRKALNDLRRFRIRVLVNVSVYTEGFDEPLLGCVQVCRATLSLGRWIQMAGRGLRPITDTQRQWCAENGVYCPKKPRVILLDHGGNVQRHGFPTEDRHWSLEGRDMAAARQHQLDHQASGRIRSCPGCGRLYIAARSRCPQCGKSPGELLPRALHATLVRLGSGASPLPAR